MGNYFINKRIIIISSGVVVFLSLIFGLISFFYQRSGIEVRVNPKNTYFYLSGAVYQGDQIIKLKPGDYSIIAYHMGYKKKEIRFKIQPFKKAVANISLEKTILLLSDLPYSENSETYSFIISGYYDDFSEPMYNVIYSDDHALQLAKKWLSTKGIDITKTNINYSLDGD